MKSSLAFLTLLLLLPSMVSATEYFVGKTNCNNNGPGSFSNPWCTLSKATSSISPGDTVTVRGGIYVEAITINTDDVTFRNYPGEKPLIDGEDRLPGGSWGNLLTIKSNDFTVDGFEFKRSTGRGILVDGPSLDKGDRAVIRNCLIHHMYRQGIFFMDGADHGTAEYNTIHTTQLEYLDPNYNNWASAIACRNSKETTIRGNIVRDNYGEGINMFWYCDGGLIENNIVYNNRACEIYLDTAKDFTVRYNLIYGTTDSEFWRGGNPSAGIAINNEKEDGFSRGFGQGYRIYNNLLANNGVNIPFWLKFPGSGKFTDIKIFNNILVEAKETAVNIRSEVTGIEFRNNIILQSSGTPINAPSSGVTFSNNLWSRPSGDIDSDAGGPGDVYGQDPLLSKSSGWSNLASGILTGQEFTLQEGSPAINAGANLGSGYQNALDPISTWPSNVKILNQNDYGNWEIGAFVFNSDLPSPPECTQDQNCSNLDDLPCVEGYCDLNDNICKSQFTSNLCDDSIACTENDQCSQGACSGIPNDALCTERPECSQAQCTPTGCSYSGCPGPESCDDIILLLHMDSNAQDSSGWENHGIVHGAISSEGLFSQSLQFDGTDDCISLPSLPLKDDSFTISLWAFPDTNPSQKQNLFGAHSEALAQQSLVLRIVDNRDFLLGYWADDLKAPGSITFGDWNHIVASYDKLTDTSRVYVNGQERASGNQGPFLGDSPQVSVGNWLYNNAHFFKGLIDDLAIWNRTLSEKEIQDIFTSGQTISCRRSIHPADTSPQDGCITITELTSYINRWLTGSDVSMPEMMGAVNLWRSGQGCSD